MKSLKWLFVIITFIIISSTCSAYTNQVELFFVPEQNFIRVHARIPLSIRDDFMSLRLFPNAQITSLWLPGLQNYSIKQNNTITLVELILAPEASGEQILEINYEGFLSGNDIRSGSSLTPELLWFPQVITATDSYHIKITVPTEYEPIIDGELINYQKSTFAIYTWAINQTDYPVVFFDNEHLNEDIQSDLKTYENEEDKEDQTVETLDLELIAQMYYFDQAITNRDSSALSGLIHQDFPQRRRFIEYALSKPGNDSIESEIISWNKSDEFIHTYNHVKVDESMKYKTHSVWVNEHDWSLYSFVMVPFAYDLIYPQGCTAITDSTLIVWIDEFLNAIQTHDLPWLDYHLTMSLSEKRELIALLQTINNSWDAFAIMPENHQLVAIGKTGYNDARIKFIFQLVPKANTWQVKHINAEPVYY